MSRIPALIVAGLSLSVLAVPAAQAEPRAAGSITFRHSLQPIDGFGFSQAFQRADRIRGLSQGNQREVLDLLLSRRTGAGLSILRLGIGSSADNVYDHMRSIQPVDPGGPTAPPKYVWDGDDGGQVWLAKQAKAYGVTRFYADAWSAPGYMKDNGDDANGGTLCGLQGTSCASGDWRQAYADYLVQYARFYAKEGVVITDLGFTNEPDLTTSYASMRFTPAQAAEFTKVFGPRVRRSGMPIKVACCDAAGWSQQIEYTTAIEADPVARAEVATHTGHPYRNPVTGPLPTSKRTWMSEWSPNGTTWNEAWDDNSGYDGFAVAQNIHDTLTAGQANGYVFWFGASLGATRGLIQLGDGTDSYRVSKRLWALASYSRFIRPDAVRVQARSGDAALKVSAYRNVDGSRVVTILNTAATTVSTDFTLDVPGRPAAYVTDTTRSMSATDTVRVRGRTLSAHLAPRSLTTVVLR